MMAYVITMARFSTPACPTKYSVLQGDCLSPLILCFNTFFKQEKCKQFVFSPHNENHRFLHLVLWFQFADDAAVVTTSKRKNQLLLNCFSWWC